ncbi:hypothetical protein [Streptomyces sp. NPDC050546]|uniref:hypothetical protein n=1 Tax=Streptomyces sp. NPDC050546 TaxID=3365628 RepID=UPI0037AC3425
MSEENLHEIMSNVERSVRDFTDAEVALTEAQQRFDLMRQNVLDRVECLRDAVEAVHAPELIEVLRHLYWQQPGIHGRALAEAAGLTLNDMLAAIGPTPSGTFCTNCGSELLRTSRSWKPSGRQGRLLCPDCAAHEQHDRSRQWSADLLRARFISEAAVEAPLRDWRAAAELVLAYPPLSQHIERGSTADHQEGIWRGWENARVIRNRLIRAAAADDDVVTVPARLAQQLVSTALKVADWDSARTRDIVDPITHEPALALLTRLNRATHDTVQDARHRAAAMYPEGYEPSPDELDELWSGTDIKARTS